MLVLWEEDGFLLLLGDENCDLSTGAHGRNEQIVADHIELLLIISGDVGGTGETGEVDEGGAADVVGDGFEGKLEGVAEEAETCMLVSILGKESEEWGS